MTNANDMAFPLFDGETCATGMTKREYFAAKALQGYIAAGGNGMPEPEQLALYAVTAADALIKALSETHDPA